MRPLDLFLQALVTYYAKVEDFVTKGEQNEALKLQKKMLVYHIHSMLVFFIVLPFFNPYFTRNESYVFLLYVFSQLWITRTKNYTIIIGFFLVNSLIALHACSLAPNDTLKVIGVVLIQHNQAFLIGHNKSLSFIFVVLSILIANNSESKFKEMLEQNNIEGAIHAFNNFRYTWPFFYIVNTCASIYLTERFRKSFQQSQDAQIELKKKNEELFAVNEKLETTLRLLEQANKDLKDAIHARELFIASVSHELRNPLNSMLGNIELLSLELKDPKLLRMLETCKICGEVLLGLINNILDVAKINAEKLEVNLQPGNLHRLLEKVWVVSAIKMRQKGIKGHLLVGRNVPKYIEMDAHRLNQIFLNLIGNATKFTKEGFVKVIVTWIKDGDTQQRKDLPSQEFVEMLEKTTSEKSSPLLNVNFQSLERQLSLETSEVSNWNEIDVQRNDLQRVFSTKSLSHLKFMSYTNFDENDNKIQEKLSDMNMYKVNQKGMLKIEVMDSGCGIPATAIENLFRPFIQADSSITRRFGGTGLGLYIAKQLIQKMGGQISVKSQEDVGTDFYLGIPTQTTKNEENKQELDNQDPSLIPNKVLDTTKALIVDDDPLNQMILTNYLKKLNVQSEIASNGQEALNKFKASPESYSFITMDIQMPVMDGMSACKAIRRYENQRRIPIIVITANCTDDEKNECLNKNGEIKASYFFRKPFTFEECTTAVKTLINKNEKGYNINAVNERQLKVLISDDDIFNTTILKEYLEKFNFSCEVCSNGKEAVSLTSAKKFDVVLMDCEMPILDGYSAARQIKARYPNLLIIGVTGNLREDCIKKARNSGMDDIETKPVNFQKLIKRIRKSVSSPS